MTVKHLILSLFFALKGYMSFFVQEMKFEDFVCSFSKYIYSVSLVFKELDDFF